MRTVRGAGLMLGAVLDGPGPTSSRAASRDGLLINCTADRVLRVTPPLIVTADEVDEAWPMLDRALAATA